MQPHRQHARRGRWEIAASTVATAAALFSGCATSRVADDAAVRIHGVVVDSAGHGLSGVTVRLVKEADLGEALAGLGAIAATVGIACVSPSPPVVCQRARTVTTGPDGGYAFDLRGADTKGTIGQASTVDVVVSYPGDAGAPGPSTTAGFQVQTEDLPLPDLRPWTSPTSVTSSGDQLIVSAAPFVGDGSGGSPGLRTRITDSASRELWSAGATGWHAEFDHRVLEDTIGTVHLEATTHLTAPGTPVDMTYTTAPAGISGTGRAADSRHATCAQVTAAGVTHRVTPSCPLTDGDLVTDAGAVLAGCPDCPPEAAHVVIDLGNSGVLSLVVVRGAPSVPLAVESSEDGITWQPYGTVSGPDATTSPGHAAARYVRVGRPADSLDLRGLIEVSAFR